MTREEYKTGMFHAVDAPKADTSSIQSPKPSTITTSNLATMDNSKPIKTVPDQPKTWASAKSTSNELNPPPPAIQPPPGKSPDTTIPTQAKPIKPANIVTQIKDEKLKPLSQRLSTLGETLNKAHATGKLKEGSSTFENDIQNLLKTVGKLKSQVDRLRSDQTEVGSIDTLSQPESYPEIPPKTISQSAPSFTSTSQLQQTSTHAAQSVSNKVGGSDWRENVGKNNTLTKPGINIPLTLRILDQTTNKNQTTAKILLLNLSDKLKPAENKSLSVQEPSTATLATNSVSENPSTAEAHNNLNGAIQSISKTQSTSSQNKIPNPQVLQQTNVPLHVNATSNDVRLGPPLTNVVSGAGEKQLESKIKTLANQIVGVQKVGDTIRANTNAGQMQLSQTQTAGAGLITKRPSTSVTSATQAGTRVAEVRPLAVNTNAGTMRIEGNPPKYDESPSKVDGQTSALPQPYLTASQNGIAVPSKFLKQVTVADTHPQNGTATLQKAPSLTNNNQIPSQINSPPQATGILSTPQKAIPSTTLAQKSASQTSKLPKGNSIVTSQTPTPLYTTTEQTRLQTIPQAHDKNLAATIQTLKTTNQITAYSPPQTSLPAIHISTPPKVITHISTQGGTTNGEVTPTQPKRIASGQPVHERGNMVGRLRSAKPGAALGEVSQQRNVEDFTAVERKLSKAVLTEDAAAKSSIPGR